METKMDNEQYSYDGRIWVPNPTVSFNNSFFHSAFGEKNSEGEYSDKHARTRRLHWSTLLTYYENEVMPSSLQNIFRKCLKANKQLNYESADSAEFKNRLEKYIHEVMFAEKPVTLEDIAILSALENIKIVVFSDGSQPIIVKPDFEILGDYLTAPVVPKEEVVLCLNDDTFYRLTPVDKETVLRSQKHTSIGNVDNDDSLQYEKSGSACGSKGVDFQVDLLTVFLLNAFRKLTNWKLSTEHKKAGKFDDAVIECSEGVICLQAKHREDRKRKINLTQLMSFKSNKDDFSLTKYFLSYLETKEKFQQMKNIIICTNVGIEEKTLQFFNRHRVGTESMLHYKDGITYFYTFNEKMLTHLKDTLKKHSVNYVEEDLKEFLNRLHCYFNYPSEKDMVKVIEHLLLLISSTNNKYGHIFPSEVNAKVKNWFQQKTGVFFTETYARAMFFEISKDKHFQILEQYKVVFLDCLDFQESKRIFHITSDSGHLLQELKIFHTMRKVYSGRNILYINAEDSLEIQNEKIEAFGLPHYGFLIIVVPKIGEQQGTVLYNKLKSVLNKGKKVILVTERNNELIQQIATNNKKDYDLIERSITLEDFDEDTREGLLKKKHIIFQGNDVSFEELFKSQPSGDYSEIMSSEILEQLIRGERIRIGWQVQPLDDDVAHYYINREFKMLKEKDKGETNYETFHETNIYEVKDKFVLIVDSAGMGKSTILAKLAVDIKSKYPHLWVIRIELNKYSHFYKRLQVENKELTDIVEFLNSMDTTKFTNQLEELVFKTNQKVVLLLDGVDEISPDYTSLLLNLLSRCREASNFAKVFVTTRPHMAKQLKEQLKVKSCMLQPFTEQNQIDFLTSYWIHNLQLNSDVNKDRCKSYAISLIGEVQSWTNSDEQIGNNLTAIPLQVKILAEVFENSSAWGGCKKYLDNMDEAVPKFPSQMNMGTLFGMFIEKKREVFMEKENPNGNATVNEALNGLFDECLNHHEILALETILVKSQYDLFLSYRRRGEKKEANMLKVGIVQKMDKECHFIHRTFAEYFLAKCLLTELEQQNANVDFQMLFIDRLLWSEEFKIVRAFFDSFLTKIVDSLPSTTFKIYQDLKFKVTFSSENDDYTLVQRLAEEGCVAILRLLLKCIDFKVVRKHSQQTTPRVPKSIRGNQLNKIQFLVSHDGINIVNGRQANTPLYYAAQNGHLKMVKFLLDCDADVNRGNECCTTLCNAVIYDHLDIVKYLVEHGSYIDLKTHKDVAALYESIDRNHVSIAEYLLEKILEKNGLAVEAFIIPYMASYLGRIDIISNLIRLGLDVNDSTEDGKTLLSSAARGGQLGTIDYLVKQGANLNSTDNYCNTVLHQISNNSLLISCATELVRLGIDINARNENGNTALHKATESGAYNMVEELLKSGADANIKNGEGRIALHLAIENKHQDILMYLLSQRPDYNIVHGESNAAIHVAAMTGNLEALKFFMVTAVNWHVDQIPLQLAVDCDQWDIVKFFIEEYSNYATDHLAKVNNILHLAVEHSDLNTIKYLVDCGVDVNAKNIKDYTALQVAAIAGEVNIVQFIMRHGGDFDDKSKSGRTLLHLACQGGHFRTVKVLLEHIKFYKDLKYCDIQDENGRTALHLAAFMGYIDIVKLLTEYVANPNIKDKSGYAALNFTACNSLEVNAYLHLGQNRKKLQFKHFDKENACLDSRYSDILWYWWKIKLILLHLGANVKVRNGPPALHLGDVGPLFSTSKAYKDIVRCLVEAGARVNETDGDDWTVLHLAVIEGDLDTITFLVDHGVSVNIKDSKRLTALHLAVLFSELCKCSQSVVEYLVVKGADLHSLTSAGDTASMLAKKYGYLELQRYLEAQELISVRHKLNLV